jgi:hypothetical protein
MLSDRTQKLRSEGLKQDPFEAASGLSLRAVDEVPSGLWHLLFDVFALCVKTKTFHTPDQQTAGDSHESGTHLWPATSRTEHARSAASLFFFSPAAHVTRL